MSENSVESSPIIGQLTESLEDYLEIIYRLLQTNKVARVRDIAGAKNVKTSSVTSALQRLAKEGFVEYKAREYVDLTQNGRELAFRLNQRHTFLKRFLTDLLQVDPETAEHDACSMEHSISVQTLEKIAALSEFLTYCPKVSNDPIAQFRDCWLIQKNDEHNCEERSSCRYWKKRIELAEKLGIHCLAEMQEGLSGHIARIMADDKTRYKLIQRGFLPTASIKIERSDENGNFDLLVSGEQKQLSREEAESVFVWAKPSELETKNTKPDPELNTLTLAQLTPGSRFRVIKLKAKGEIRQRLLDMGFIRGTYGRVLREALLRDPIEIELKGYLLSLRRAEAKDILVEEIDE